MRKVFETAFIEAIKIHFGRLITILIWETHHTKKY